MSSRSPSSARSPKKSRSPSSSKKRSRHEAERELQQYHEEESSSGSSQEEVQDIDVAGKGGKAKAKKKHKTKKGEERKAPRSTIGMGLEALGLWREEEIPKTNRSIPLKDTAGKKGLCTLGLEVAQVGASLFDSAAENLRARSAGEQTACQPMDREFMAKTVLPVFMLIQSAIDKRLNSTPRKARKSNGPTSTQLETQNKALIKQLEDLGVDPTQLLADAEPDA